MNVKLFKKNEDANKNMETMSIEEFDAIEGEHVFSEEYEKKKQSILIAFQQSERTRTKGKMMKAAMVAIALIMVSGSAVALNANYIESAYQSLDSDIDQKYWYIDFAHPKYDLPVTIETDSTNDLLSFQVLQADKGKNAVSFAVLITVNDPDFEVKQGYELDYQVVQGDIVLTGQEQAGCLYGNGWGDKDCKIELPDNQQLQFWEYTFSDSVDMEQVDSIDVTFAGVYRRQIGPDVLMQQSADVIEESLDDEHKWILHIPLSGNYDNYTYTIDNDYTLFDESVRMNKISISPSGMRVLYAVYDMSEDDVNTEKHYKDANCVDGIMEQHRKDIKLIMSDGKKIPLEKVSHGNAVGKSADSDTEVEEYYYFDVPIDPNQVTGIKLDGQVIDLK